MIAITLQALPRILLMVSAFLTLATAAIAVEIQQVKSPLGISAWLVEDYAVPLVTVAVSFRGGSSQDPVNKEGMADLLSTLFDEGAGGYDSRAFQARLEKYGINLGYSDSRDRFSGGLRALKQDSVEAFELMRLSLTGLRFDRDSIGRMRDALKAQIAGNANDSGNRASDALRQSLFSGHPYARRSTGTAQSLDTITRDDLVAQFKALFARDNLVVAVVGAISGDETAAMLDKVFGQLPLKARLQPVGPAEVKFGGRIEIEDTGSQTTIALALPGLGRQSPDYLAAYLMNHVLGGGTFSSRLYDEIREKRGLAYSVGSSLSTLDHAAYLTASLSTRADRAEEVIALVKAEIERMANDGPTERELSAAKRFVIGSYAINNLDTSSKIAQVLISMQTENLGIDYIERREGLINAVTLEQVKAVAKRLLANEPTIIVVGPKKS